jgi:hypothetical protein
MLAQDVPAQRPLLTHPHRDDLLARGRGRDRADGHDRSAMWGAGHRDITAAPLPHRPELVGKRGPGCASEPLIADPAPLFRGLPGACGTGSGSQARQGRRANGLVFMNADSAHAGRLPRTVRHIVCDRPSRNRTKVCVTLRSPLCSSRVRCAWLIAPVGKASCARFVSDYQMMDM